MRRMAVLQCRENGDWLKRAKRDVSVPVFAIEIGAGIAYQNGVLCRRDSRHHQRIVRRDQAERLWPVARTGEQE